MKHITRLLAAVLVFTFTLGLLCTGASAGSLAYGAATVTAAVLNIRKGTSTGTSIVGTVSKGNIVVVLERTNDDWYKVNYQGKSGYASSDYLTNLTTSASFNMKGSVNYSEVVVRKGAGTSYNRVATCSFGEAVDIIGIKDGWYKVVTVNSVTGYIRSDLIDITGSSSDKVVSTEGADDDSSDDSSGSTDFTKTTGTVFGYGVRFRTGPGTKYDYTTSLDSGDKLTVIGKEGDWYKAVYDGVTGYIYSKYVTLASTEEKSESTEEASASGDSSQTGTITGSSVRFRSAANTSSTVICLLAKNSKVSVLSKDGNWYKCVYNNKTGYVHQDYVSLATSSDDKSSDAKTDESSQETAATDPNPGVLATSGTVACDTLILRSSASTGSSIVTNLKIGATVTIKSASDGWLKVTSGSYSGYVSGEYISILPSASSVQVGTVTGTGVRFRKGAGTSYGIICTMPKNAAVCIYEVKDNWVKCSYNGKLGYIAAAYVTVGSVAAISSSDSTLGEQAAQFACQFEGYEYVYGEESPSKGFDCSGLVYYVYKTHFGYSMHRGARAQYSYDGTYVTKDNLQPGDLVFFSSDGSGVTHVGIYVGSGKYGTGTFIHASGTGIGVIYSDLNSSYYSRVYYGAKRIV